MFQTKYKASIQISHRIVRFGTKQIVNSFLLAIRDDVVYRASSSAMLRSCRPRFVGSDAIQAVILTPSSSLFSLSALLRS